MYLVTHSAVIIVFDHNFLSFTSPYESCFSSGVLTNQ